MRIERLWHHFVLLLTYEEEIQESPQLRFSRNNMGTVQRFMLKFCITIEIQIQFTIRLLKFQLLEDKFWDETIPETNM